MMLMDKRQRAMLREMGVRVWQPLPEAREVPAVVSESVKEQAVETRVKETPTEHLQAKANPESAMNSEAASARVNLAKSTFNAQKQPLQPTVGEPKPPISASGWRIGQAQNLYAQAGAQTAPHWLVLLEAPDGALLGSFKPFEGDAGKLLDNMLRAAKLHTAARVTLAPLVRGAQAGGQFPAMFADLFTSLQPDVVLVMGRLAAQALLQSSEPLPKLRGQVHTLYGRQIVITIDPAYLLRTPLDKAKAWDDLCLALSLPEKS